MMKSTPTAAAAQELYRSPEHRSGTGIVCEQRPCEVHADRDQNDCRCKPRERLHDGQIGRWQNEGDDLGRKEEKHDRHSKTQRG